MCELQMKHTEELGSLKTGLKAADKRIDDTNKRIDNFDDFLKEMRKMNVSMVEMNGNVQLLAFEIKNVTTTMVAHEEAIESIQEKMETKEGMARLYTTVEEVLLKQEDLTERMFEEENKEAKAALSAMNRIKWYIMGSIASILLAIVMVYLKLK